MRIACRGVTQGSSGRRGGGSTRARSGRAARAQQGLQTAAAAAGLSKFFERIDNQILIDEARKHCFPQKLRRLNLSAYSGIRRCRLEGTYGRPVQAWRTVGPGCSHAMTLIKLYTLSSLDRVENRNPGVRMSVLVDDVSGQTRGGPGGVLGPRVSSRGSWGRTRNSSGHLTRGDHWNSEGQLAGVLGAYSELQWSPEVTIGIPRVSSWAGPLGPPPIPGPWVGPLGPPP